MTYIFDAPKNRSTLQHSQVAFMAFACGFNIKLISVRITSVKQVQCPPERNCAHYSDGSDVQHGLIIMLRYKQTLEYMNNEYWPHNAISIYTMTDKLVQFNACGGVKLIWPSRKWSIKRFFETKIMIVH